MHLRIVVWNCNMRLHDKIGELRALRPDVAVVPECACPEVFLQRSIEQAPDDMAWEGLHPRKGLGVLAFGPWRLAVTRAHRPGSATTLPLRVAGPRQFRLLAVWGLPRWAHRRSEAPPEPLGAALERLLPFLACPPAIVAGDFNRLLLGRGRASPLARRLAALGFVSAYHRDREVGHGAEPEPTFCRYRRLPGRHHADHVFVDRATARGVTRVAIGRAGVWVARSDHLPLIVDLAL